MGWYGNTSQNVGYPEPKRQEREGICPYCYRNFDKYVFSNGDEWMCERCFREELEDNFTLTDIADALGYNWIKAEDMLE